MHTAYEYIQEVRPMKRIILSLGVLFSFTFLFSPFLETAEASGRMIRPPKIDPCKKNPDGERCKKSKEKSESK